MVAPDRLRALPARRLPGGLVLLEARSWRSRLRGLAGLRALPSCHALELAPCASVHTLGMRFALDLVWLDGAGRPLRVDEDVAPGRLRGCRRARAVVEAPAGQGARWVRALTASAGGSRAQALAAGAGAEADCSPASSSG